MRLIGPAFVKTTNADGNEFGDPQQMMQRAAVRQRLSSIGDDG